ncbi:MAG: acetate--CoA ligase family protein [Candidatus Micrarchaeia archaeon]
MATKKTPNFKDLRYIINPKSVAIIGASDIPDKIGHIILENYIDAGYGGALYPVNTKGSPTIMGLKAYKSVLDIHKSIDLAVIAIPAPYVPEVLEECGKAHVKSTIVVSSGFAEVGNTDLENQIKEISEKYNMPMLGPNCLGVVNLKARTNTMFLPSFKLDIPKIGGVSFVSQSGAIGSTLLDLIAHEGFGLSKFISYGNATDIDEIDILNYLMHDKDTKVIVLYIEGVKRGPEIIELGKKITKIKPVIVIKGGMTDAGVQAAHSHTASLTSSFEAYSAAFKQAGFIVAEDIQDLLDLSKIFQMKKKVAGDRVAIITDGGGAGVLTTDAISNAGLKIAELSEDSKKQLREAMPPIVNIRLPLDIGGDADDSRYSKALEVLTKDSNVDVILVIVLFQTPGADSRVAATVVHYGVVSEKPIIAISIGGNYTLVHKTIMESSGIPVYDSPRAAAKAISAFVKYSTFKV